MEPTPEQIEQACRARHQTYAGFTGPILQCDLQDGLNWFRAWEQVCPRPKALPMGDCYDIAVNTLTMDEDQVCEIICELARRGHLTIEERKDGD